MVPSICKERHPLALNNFKMVNGKAVESSEKENVQIENLIEDSIKFMIKNLIHEMNLIAFFTKRPVFYLGLQPEEFHFMLADHEGGKRHYSESCEDDEMITIDTNEGSNNEGNIF